MDDADVVEFDRNRGIVELGTSAEQLVDYLDADGEVDRDWPQYYMGLALGGAVLFLGGVAGLYPAGWIADLVVLGVIGAFAVCAFAHDRATAEAE
jgi:hypothetical protein